LTSVQFVSTGAPTGYGLAAISYVRGLVNAGIPVHWVQTQWNRPTLGFEPRMTPAMAGDESLRDVAALTDATRRPLAHDCCVVQLPPEEWARWHRAGQHNVGYTAWETDRPPAHWLPLLNAADTVLVPCRFNQASFVQHGVRSPVLVVPHVRRHRWNTFSPVEREAALSAMGIAAGKSVFYCISSWDVRKNLATLVRAFAHAFKHDDAVSLLIKTSAQGNSDGPLHELAPSAQITQATLDAVSRQLQRDPPHVHIIARDTVSGRDIDALHEIGDCYVSLSHGEGWGLGAFDAASRGTPVIATPWSATADFMGERWPGALPYTMAGASLWPVIKPSYFPSMRWAQPDVPSAVRLLRDFAVDPVPFRAAAHAIERDILRRFSEPVVTRTLLDAITPNARAARAG